MRFDDGDRGRIGRRDFLALSAYLMAAMSLGGPLGPGISHARDTKFPEGRCGDNRKKRVLVTYASKYGSTGGVAEAIGQELCAQDVEADMVLVKNVREIGSYHGVVIGSAIYMGKWRSEAADFVKKNRDILCQVPVAYFLVCLTMAQPTEKNRAEALSYLDPILQAVPEIKPVGIGTFAGALDYNNLSGFNRKIMKSKGAPEGDFRDWAAIRAWAREPVSARFVH